VRVAILKTLALIVAALGLALVEPVRRKTVTDDDEDVGLFVGSAYALPAKPRRAAAVGRRSTAR